MFLRGWRAEARRAADAPREAQPGDGTRKISITDLCLGAYSMALAASALEALMTCRRCRY